MEPEGALWKELLAMGDSRLSYVYRPQQETMYGTRVTKLAAMSDVLRTDILLKYGGIYTGKVSYLRDVYKVLSYALVIIDQPIIVLKWI